MVSEWITNCEDKGIPISDDFNLLKIMGDPVVIRDWQQKGLPTDLVSTENGVFVNKGKRWPLLIDP